MYPTISTFLKHIQIQVLYADWYQMNRISPFVSMFALQGFNKWQVWCTLLTSVRYAFDCIKRQSVHAWENYMMQTGLGHHRSTKGAEGEDVSCIHWLATC